MGGKVLGFTLEDGAQDSVLPLACHLCMSLLSLRFSSEQYGQHILRTGHLGFSDPGRLTEVGQASVSRDSSQSHLDSLKNLKVGEAWSPATRNGAQGTQRRREAGHQLSRAQRLAERVSGLTCTPTSKSLCSQRLGGQPAGGLEGIISERPSLPCPSHADLAGGASFQALKKHPRSFQSALSLCSFLASAPVTSTTREHICFTVPLLRGQFCPMFEAQSQHLVLF